MPRITAIETAIPHGIMPNLLLVRERIPVYNTCGGPSYGALQQAATGHPGWPGYGFEGRPGPLEDRGPVIERGAALLPEGPGLGTRFHDALFKPGINLYRRSG